MHAFDYGLVLQALEKHVRMAQSAANFARHQHKGALYAQAMLVLVEAERAQSHVKQQREQAYSKVTSN